MINRLGNLEPLIPDRPALGERAELSMARSEVRRGEHGGEILAEALVGPLSRAVRVCERQSIARR